MIRITCFAGTVIVLALTAKASGGGPPPVCMAVDKIVLGPSDVAPTRIQIWGTFIFLEDSRSMYGAPVRGYLYYTAVPGKEEECRKQWADLRELAAEDQIVAYGLCGTPKIDGQLRKALEEPENPIVFPLCQVGFTPAERYADSRLLRELLTTPTTVSPADGEHLRAGRVTLMARKIRDKEHSQGKYVFEIQSNSGEREESPPIAAGEKQLKWSPNIEVKAGEIYTWRVRASEGTWQGPSTSSHFRGEGK
jgi:hypothetical protein